MDIKDLEEQLRKSEASGNTKEVIDILEKIQSLMKEELDKTNNSVERRVLNKGHKLYDIKLYENKIKIETDNNKRFYLRGKLIKALKEYKNYAIPSEVNILRDKLDKQLAIQKEESKNIRVSNKDKIKLKDRVGLNIKEISNTIKLFLSKHDVINKFKNTCKSTLIGGGITLGIESIITLLLGATLSPSLIISSLPIMGYIGISSLVRNILTKTSYQKYEYKNSKEYQELIKNVPIEYKEEYEKIKSLLEEKKDASNLSITSINNKLVELYNKIITTTKVEELRDVFKVEKYNLLQENKKIYEEVIDKHLKDKARLSDKEYQTIKKEQAKNDIALFESENAIKEAGKDALKKSKIDIITLLVARLVVSSLIPGYALTSIKDLLIPLGFMLSNNLIGMIKYNKKLVNTKYDNKKVNINNKEKFEELAKVNNLKTVTI